MKPDCKCFTGDMRGEDNATLVAIAVDDVFSQAMAAYRMCPKSGHYVVLTAMVLLLRKTALVEWREKNEDLRDYEEMSELEKIEMVRAEREGFKRQLETLVADLIVREWELEAKSMADRDAVGMSS